MKLADYTIDDFRTSDEMERAMFADAGIEKTSETEYRVPSSSGRGVYTVKFEGRTEDDFATLWECSCPAFKICKHVRQVTDIIDHVSDQYGMD